MSKTPFTTGRGIKLHKAYFEFPEATEIPVMFNPETIQWTQKLSWKAQEQAKKGAPFLHFTCGEPQKMSFKLQYDTSGMPGDDGKVAGAEMAPDVRQFISPILKLTEATESVGTSADVQKEPPVVTFAWGQGLSFKCVISKCDVTFTKFNIDGSPTRCEMGIELTEAGEASMAESLHNAGSTILQPPDGSTSAAAAAGDTAKEQENWREIMEMNLAAFPTPRSSIPGSTIIK